MGNFLIRMTRRSPAETRALLLDLAVEMLHEQGVDAGVGHIRVSDVVARAGLTTGAAYRCWENQAAFHRDLAVAAVRWRDRASITATVSRIYRLVEQGAPWAEVIRAGAEANLHSYPVDAGFLTTLALRACAHGDDALANASHERHEEAMAAYAELYVAMLRVYRRRLRPSFTVRHLSAALAALSEGFAVQAMSGEPHPVIADPDAEAGACGDWTLFGLVVLAVVDRFTEPIDGPTEGG